jgi:PAS domain S-box-containing protein
VPVIADVRAIPDSPWYLVARMDVEEMYAPLKERLWLMIFLVGALLVGAGTSVSFVWRQQRNRFYHERYKSAEALRASNERLQMALESANSGAWEWDLLTNENIWSEELWNLYGLEPHSCVPSYETWWQTIHPDDRENAEKKVQEAALRGSELNAEWRVTDRDGSVRWLMSRGRPFRDSNGKAIRFIGIVLDITERKKAEIALQEAAKEREKLIQELQYALDNIKTLQGLIPICASCKKIRDDKGFWNQVEGYISQHTDAKFTHGICPDCSKKLYGNLYERVIEEQKKKNI